MFLGDGLFEWHISSMFSGSTKVVYIRQLLAEFIFQQAWSIIRDRILAQRQATWGFRGLIMIRLWGLWGMICGDDVTVCFKVLHEEAE